MNIGVLGLGRLGTDLVHAGCVGVNADIREYTDLLDALSSVSPKLDVLINTAARTEVDRCEDVSFYLHEALPVNAIGVYTLALACRDLGIKLIHMSSDYVFGGRKGPYSEITIMDEEDPPVNNYGLSKLGAEAMLMDMHNATIVRTTGLYGGRVVQHDLLSVILSVLDGGDEFSATDELYGNQTYIPHLTEGLIYASSLVKSSSVPKILHIASKDICTRFAFAQMVALIWGYRTDLIRPIQSKDVPSWIAKRPVNGGLTVDVAKSHNIPLYSITEGLMAAYEYRNSNPSV